MKKRDSTYTLDPRNTNRGTERGRKIVGKSLKRLGAGRSIVVSSEGTVIAGHKTLYEAQALGIKTREIETDGTELVVVRRKDLKAGSKKARELGIVDNAASFYGLEWEPEEI